MHSTNTYSSKRGRCFLSTLHAKDAGKIQINKGRDTSFIICPFKEATVGFTSRPNEYAWNHEKILFSEEYVNRKKVVEKCDE